MPSRRLRPGGVVDRADIVEDRLPLGRRADGEKGASHGAAGHGQARAGIHVERDGDIAARAFDIAHAQPVANAEADGRVGEGRERAHARPGKMADIQPRQRRRTQRNQRRAEAIGAALGDVVEIAELGQRVSQPRDGGAGEAATGRDLGVGERFLALAEAGQHVEPTRQRRDEVTVLLQPGEIVALRASGLSSGLCRLMLWLSASSGRRRRRPGPRPTSGARRRASPRSRSSRRPGRGGARFSSDLGQRDRLRRQGGERLRLVERRSPAPCPPRRPR